MRTSVTPPPAVTEAPVTTTVTLSAARVLQAGEGTPATRVRLQEQVITEVTNSVTLSDTFSTIG